MERRHLAAGLLLLGPIVLATGICWFFSISFWWCPVLWFFIAIFAGMSSENSEGSRHGVTSSSRSGSGLAPVCPLCGAANYLEEPCGCFGKPPA